MDLSQILADPRQQHAQVTEAIVAIERLSFGCRSDGFRPNRAITMESHDCALPTGILP